MDIIIKDLDFIKRSVKASDVFSGDTMAKAYMAIRNDFYDDIIEGWSGTTIEDIGYDWRTTIGDLRLEKQAIEYAIYASELNLHDFLEEFIDYVEDDYDQYLEFVKNVEEGKYKLIASDDF